MRYDTIDTIYYILHPIYSGVEPNCHDIARSACRVAHSSES